MNACIAGVGDERLIEASAVDDRAAKVRGVVQIAHLDHRGHRADGLTGGRSEIGDVRVKRSRDELRTLHRKPGHLLAVDTDHAEPGSRSGGSGAGAGRPEPYDNDIRALAGTHAAHPTRLVMLPPILTEQQACCCVNGRPIARATATAPSAGKAMPSRPAMTA